MRLSVFSLLIVGLSAWPEYAAENGGGVALDAGRVYLYVDGAPVRGKDLIEPLVRREYHKRKKEVTERLIVSAELAAHGIEVRPRETGKGLDALCRVYQTQNRLPYKPRPAELAEIFGRSQASVLEGARLLVGVLKLLRREGRIPYNADPASLEILDAYSRRTRSLVDIARVVDDPKELPEGVALEINGTEISYRKLADALLQSMAPQDALEALRKAAGDKAYELILSRELAARGLVVNDDTKRAAFKMLLKRIEDKQYLEPGQGMEVFKKYLDDQDITKEEYLASRDFYKTCAVDMLLELEGEPAEKDLRRFFEKNHKHFGAGDPLLESIFIKVTDAGGKPFRNFKTGIAAVDRLYARARRKSFDSARQRARAAAALAASSFVKAVRKFSDDLKTRARDGEVGYIGAGDKPKPPFTPAIYRYARENLKEEKVSEPVECEYGFHVMRITARRKPTFPEMRRAVKVAYWNKRRDDLLARLWKATKFKGELAPRQPEN